MNSKDHQFERGSIKRSTLVDTPSLGMNCSSRDWFSLNFVHWSMGIRSGKPSYILIARKNLPDGGHQDPHPRPSPDNQAWSFDFGADKPVKKVTSGNMCPRLVCCETVYLSCRFGPHGLCACMFLVSNLFKRSAHRLSLYHVLHVHTVTLRVYGAGLTYTLARSIPSVPVMV